MSARRIVVLGGGFAGLWTAVGAVRKLDELGHGPDQVEVTLVNRDQYHSIRVRNYEADLSRVRVPLDQVLGPIGVSRVEGHVAGIDLVNQTVAVTTPGGTETLGYDRLVFALGSELTRPDIPGLAENAFDVDTYDGAARLNAHLRSLPGRALSAGRLTVVIVGGGLTGIESAAEMPGKLRSAFAEANQTGPFRVILADHRPRVGSTMGEFAAPLIEEALGAVGVEILPGIAVAAITPERLELQSGATIATNTVVWCAGMRASGLTRSFPVATDPLGRIAVDPFLRVQGVNNVFAAGDAAWTMVDDAHRSVMSCQHSRPMGRFAGHNVVADLLGLPMLPLRIESYVTILDLGPWGALYTEGWDRRVVATGAVAKTTKRTINGQRIYPPLSGNRSEILAAAAPVVQRPPEVKR